MPPKKEKAKPKAAPEKGTAAAAKEEKAEPPAPAPRPRLRDVYRDLVAPALTKEFGYTNVMQIPRLRKIVVNMGVGQAGQTGGDAKLLDNAMRDMSIIVGQKPCVTRAKKSISNFKIRAGARIGCKVTLRGDMMFEFLDRFVATALPRVRDFQGISPNCFDGRGNFATGVREQLIFPEIEYDKIDKVRGMDIIICTSARTDQEARSLLKGLGMPFRER
ncbi:MAG: 50S ribosomal protein L5 [Armatimonadetes bacterium]|nr:50S ribosomal protein L5 [Armatimonadota bacterium]